MIDGTPSPNPCGTKNRHSPGCSQRQPGGQSIADSVTLSGKPFITNLRDSRQWTSVIVAMDSAHPQRHRHLDAVLARIGEGAKWSLTVAPIRRRSRDGLQ